MGNTRTLIAWLVVLSLQLAPRVTYADVGPGREVQAIRHALPIILARRLRASGLDPKNLVVDDVTVHRNDAVAKWLDGDVSETSPLHYSLGTWWYGFYAVTTRLAGNDTTESAPLGDVLIRPPTQGESWLTPNDDSYAFFSLTPKTAATVRVEAGMNIDVWFPFVLDPSKTYTLDIAHTEPTIDSVKGMLKDNTLHFVLPAFAAQPGV
ncbi:MAG TPA: hypothetical protein VNF68_00045, partial [Candidatus Baltobacteraceae bacterium]|nr:hypothetical protein [Candidatus Baltobacteraceae bacterium]